MADVGGIINRLAPLIEEKVKNEYNLWINSKTEARKLYFNLKEIQKLLEEAERRRLLDPRVKTWLENLQDITYEIDDVLDEWETLDLQLQIHDVTYEIDDIVDEWENDGFLQHSEWFDDEDDDDDSVSHTWLEKISIFIESLCSCSKYVFRRRDVAFKIKELNEKVDSVGKETAKYTLLPITSESQDVKCEITTSFSDLIEIPCQRTYRDKLVNQLLSHEGEKPGDIQVISLVGMVGIGKTTLAQLAFNDPKVNSKFELKSWICISHISNMLRLAKAILQSFCVSYPEDAELQTLLKIIQRSIFKKKFLVVLDHARTEDDSIWNQLKGCLRYGAPESIILVTSRNENVQNLVGSTQVIEVQPLNETDCWLLFNEIAFRGRSEMDKDKLGRTGRRIARKCEGLPLAAKTLGYYLQSRCIKELWEDVLEKEVWQLDEVAKPLFASLAFSYNEFPLALKQCFSFCAILEEGVKFGMDDLIKLWMVQGYIETELKGRDYFEKLVKNSFFQRVRKKNSGETVQKYAMHRILLDFARYLKKTGSKVEELRNFFSDGQLSPTKLGNLRSVRLLVTTCITMRELPSEIGNLVHLRFLDLSYSDIKKLPVTICNLYNLQVLDLERCREFSELPKQIHRLRNLKDLVLSYTNLHRLPLELCNLYNLQTLDLQGCRGLSELPKQIHRLRSLRHLKISKTNLLRLPQGLQKLTNLQTLDELCVGGEANKFGFLAKLNQLQGSLKIIIGNLNEEEAVEDAKKADLKSKIYISHLKLQFDGEVRMDVLEALQVPPNLQSFVISNYEGTQFPSWLGAHLNKLGVLKFKKCNKCSELPPLGRMPFLESLKILSMKSLKRVRHEFIEISDKLRSLEFSDCDSWEEWEYIAKDEASDVPIMPCLEKLILRGCYNLKALPDLLLHKAPTLQKLVIGRGCPHLSEQCRREREFISRFPHVHIAEESESGDEELIIQAQ